MFSLCNVWYLLLVCLVIVEPSDILVIPYAYGMNSRFRDIIKMTDMLSKRGHNITVLINGDDKEYMTHIQVNTVLNYYRFTVNTTTMCVCLCVCDEKYIYLYFNK